MPTTLDCDVLRDLYGTPEVRACFESRALVQGWLDAERALVEAQAECGLVPTAAADAIARECDAAHFDLDALRLGVAESQHPLVPLVRELAGRCGPDGRWVHWGATTQDIIDTGLVLQVRAALEPIERDLGRAIRAARSLALRHRDVPMPGRTHGQHAVPITFGLKAASWADELMRCETRLAAARQAALVAQLGGAAGTLAALGADGEAVGRAFARRLDLGAADLPWHAARDRLRDLGHALAEIGAASERVATEVVRLQSTEVAEATEPLPPTHVGSSTMPQKLNPMTSEYLVASVRLLRAAVQALAGAAAHAGERDMALWAVEWIAVPQALILTGGAVDKLAAILEGLEIDAARMNRNLDLTEGRIMAEAVMMALAAHVGHEHAHAVVARAARVSLREGRPFRDALLAEHDVVAHLSADDLETLLRPGSYLGLSSTWASRTGTAE